VTNEAGGETARSRGCCRLGRVVHALPLGAAAYREVVAPEGLIRRVSRALQLDPSLYREVMAPGAGTFQAVLIVVATAAASGIAWGARMFHLIGSYETALLNVEAPMAEFGVLTALGAIAHVVAWPLWATGVWAVGKQLSPPSRAPGFGSVARVMAFAQAPGVLLLLIPIMTGAFWLGRVDPDGGGEAPLGLLASSVWSVVAAWVLLGTFLATRQVMATSNRRTLIALATAGACVAVLATLLGAAVASISLGWSHDTAYARNVPSGFDVAYGFDFSLGFGFGTAVMAYLLRLASYGWL